VVFLYCNASLEALAGAQPALYFAEVNFHEILFDDVIKLIQPWYNFSQMVMDTVLFAIFPKMRTFQF